MIHARRFALAYRGIRTRALLRIRSEAKSPRLSASAYNGGQAGTSLNSSWSNLSNLTLTGGTTTLNLNQTLSSSVAGGGLIDNTASLTLSGGNLTVTGSSTAAVTQSFASTTLAGGGSVITLADNGNANTLNLGTLTRNAGGVLYVATPTGTGTGTVNVSGGTDSAMLKSGGVAYAVYGSGSTASWAALGANGNVVSYTGETVDSGTTLGSANAGQDVEITGGNVTVTSTSLSSLLIADGAARTLSLASGQVLAVGGILSDASTGQTIIGSGSSGGTITAQAGTQELTVINDGSQQLALNAAITDNASGAVSVDFGSTTGGITNVEVAGTYTGITYIDGDALRMNGNSSGDASSTYDVGSTGTLNVNNQQITIGALEGSGTVTVGNNGNPVYSVTMGGNNASTTYDGIFTGNAPAVLNKQGTGTFRYNGYSATNTSQYLGAVNVNAGSFLVNGSLADASKFTVANGATLGGNGTVSAIAASAGAIISPGDGGIGTLSATSLTLNGSAQFNFDLSSTDTTSDLLTLSGALTDASSSTDTFEFSLTGGTVGDTYTLMDFGSTNLADASKFGIDSPGYSGNFNIVNGDELQLTLTAAAPEPSTWALLLSGVGMVIFLRRRKLC